MKIGVVLNPVAGGGRLKRRWPQIEAALKLHCTELDMRETEEAGDGERLALAFAGQGCELVIAAGGDGTASEVADGLLQARAETGTAVALGILPCGTGTDFARGLGLPLDPVEAAKRIVGATPRAIDAGRVSFIDDHGALASRHFINVASVGISGATDRAVNADLRKGRVSAKALFYWRTVVEFLRFRFQDVRIAVDDAEPFEARVALVSACNGRYFGAGMMIAPDAELDDGQFDVVIVRASGKLGLLRDLRLLYGGRHRNHHAVTILRCRKLVVEPMDATNVPLVDADGEAPGYAPATFEVLPGALLLKC
ncbi:MAG: diacylglycerol kinase family lipid kinase [Rhizobiaceae bacterium]|nr:diacylglycerol kinase family lipid kinase [Rhizobiaceae bacterium]